MISILTYYQVAEVPRSLDPMGLAVSPAQFEQQMSYLAHKGYQCLSLGEAVEHMNQAIIHRNEKECRENNMFRDVANE